MTWRRGLIAGLVGGALYVAITIGLGLFTGSPALPDLYADRLLGLTPGWLFSFFIERLQFAGKPLFYVGLVLAILTGLAILGGFYATRLAERGPFSPLVRASLFAGALLLIEEIVLVPLAGDANRGAALTAVAVQVLGFIGYAVGLSVTLGIFEAADETDVEGESPTRRALLRYGLVGALGVIAAGGVAQALNGARASGAISRPTTKTGGLPDEITPTDKFYSISKNFFDPTVDVSKWRLAVSGHVDRSLDLSLADLRALPQIEQLTTLNCISNEVGGDLISNGKWRGVRLGDLLSRAGVRGGAVKVVFTAADNYQDSITIDKAMEPTTLLALDMNDAPLNDKHGAPLRCVVPNIYGMKHAKWITKIEVMPIDFKGFWQNQGWSDPAPIRTMSRIDTPLSGSIVAAGPVDIAGIAFAGTRGISKVEISLDQGTTWQAASLRPVISPLSWQFWTAQAEAKGPAGLRIQVRAYDGKGVLQEQGSAEPYPDGATGTHTVFVQVRSA